MSYSFDGVPNNGVTGKGYFQVGYDSDATKATTSGKPGAQNLYPFVDDDFELMQTWFPSIKLRYSFPIQLILTTDAGNGASWGPPVKLFPITDSWFLRYLVVSEVTEMFMQAQGKGWYLTNEGSTGEGLSRYLGRQFMLKYGQKVPTNPLTFVIGNIWMQTPDRADYVNNTKVKTNLILCSHSNL